MPRTVRAKLVFIVAAAAFALIVLIAAGMIVAGRVETQVALIQERYVPKLELGPKLEGQLDQLTRSLQDAVAAQDATALAETVRMHEKLVMQLTAAEQVIGAVELSVLRNAIEDYYVLAREVSRRMIAGETGEELVSAIATMQNKQVRVVELLRGAMAFDRKQLAAAFAAVSETEREATEIRLIVSLACFVIVTLLSLWLSRSVLQSVNGLATGFERFGRGEFDRPIELDSRDELAALAQRANRMAESLLELNRERDRSDWLKAGYATLVHELRGELELKDVAERALRVLARHVEAPVGALYYLGADGLFERIGSYGLTDAASAAPERVQRGQGLVGEAANVQEITLIPQLPTDYVRVASGVGTSAPRSLALVPLLHLGKTTGVLELGLFQPWSAMQAELLLSVRETIAITLEVARARAALRRLLHETQRQTERLASQEEELRSRNEELQEQQDELRNTNQALTRQARELDAQRLTLEQKNSELDATRQVLEKNAVELSTVSAYKSQFLANMSHELRTPLNSMLLLSSLLADNEQSNLSAKQVEYCRTIHGAGKDLLALINQVLDLAKIESGKQEMHLDDVPLTRLTQYVQRVYEPVARHKGLEFDAEIAPGCPETIRTDAQRVEQILNNLVGNALKFTAQGRVALRIAPAPGNLRLRRHDLEPEHYIAISVSDTGIGIAPEHQERIFARFEQADASQDRRFGGSGLGLTIARELASLLGGELQLHSVPDRGSTFTCYLPQRAAAEGPLALAARNEDMLASQPMSRRGSAATGALDLLIIEDDPVFANALVDLVSAQGLKCCVASDGRAGVEIAQREQPRGVVLDVQLPDMDGWAVMAALRADPATSRIPVHFVSGVNAAERGLALGAIGYLTKPAARDDLLHMVEALASRRDQRGRILIVEDDAPTALSLRALLTTQLLDVVCVSSANQALETLARAHFDCMVLDLGLPDMDGLELIDLLKAQAPTELMPVIVYTGRALSRTELQRLGQYAETVVLKDGAGVQRVLAEIHGFAQRLKAGLRPSQRRPVESSPADAQHQLLGRKILIADDDMRTVYALSALLRGKGCEVLVADTGVTALQLLAADGEVEIVLLDLMMPEMDGYETLRHIRSDPRLAGLPVIVLTARAMQSDRQQCLDAGANDYLAKPVEAERLLTMLDTWLNPQAQRASA